MSETFNPKKESEKTQIQIAKLEVKIGELYEMFNYLFANNVGLKYPTKSIIKEFRKEAIEEVKKTYPNLDLSEIN